ncbi:CcoQ/FixQ family Cbb3-type cytochrome c oxidase assembly chaperone [Phaeocystidibacter luteus]|uniref:CcoQ/FixQ family Cbb3-type cytochrome c oxidase assembly chaperone n=1 Tax=Phaeocystidibacter luteus TaxID=911197 RepID=A0A6N6RJ84_9FLAO|nr:CcoQ/FixQ family Cbb3-type cytochrome c oxidase assembly chaperone [Phaeocystidibacter luteus]KAB2813611.1 CcoQ/FixQ family Cbb3-type cytochrome c oxidase assembly chaperone [Phaeocystidibacter luteus]NVK28494.1 CcoQ/FixQ family Cbb3-type cytochrome c oxidase assembly chaperone [Flavobacteriia bacterium]
MIKFLKGPMAAIENVEIFPIISFLIFFSFFIGLLIHVIRQDKSTIREISSLPLEGDEPTSNYKS